jgi:hypothetical protein
MGVLVGIIMGSQSDWPTMKEAALVLDQLGVAYEARIVSAHRTPDRLWDYGTGAVGRGLQVIIAGAGGAAHLPGMMASKTRVPVIGVPIQTRALAGVDSLYSIAQGLSGRYHGDRRCRCRQCRADGCGDIGLAGCGPCHAAGGVARGPVGLDPRSATGWGTPVAWRDQAEPGAQTASGAER